jgi:hypothetical protein
MLTISTFENQLRELLQARSPDAVPQFIGKDPLQRFAHWWNDAMPEVHCDFIERAYLQPQAAMTRKVAAGELKNLSHFFETFSAVLVMTGLHYRTLSYHKWNPRLRQSKDTNGDESKSLPFFVALADRHVLMSREADPADTLARKHDLRAVLEKARQLHRLPLAAYRRVKAFEFETGSHYGAFPHVARSAITNTTGQIVRFQRIQNATPTEATIRQVRRLYRTACERIEQLKTQ